MKEVDEYPLFQLIEEKKKTGTVLVSESTDSFLPNAMAKKKRRKAAKRRTTKRRKSRRRR